MNCEFEIFADILSNMLVQLIIEKKYRLTFSAIKCSSWCEKVCLEFVVLIPRVVIIQIRIRFVIIIVFLVVWFLHFVFMIVFLRNVDSVFAFIVSLISIISVFLALSFREKIWRVLIRVFARYLQRLFCEWQDRSEFWKFFLEISRIWKRISIVLTSIFWTIVLTSIELSIEELITWVNILILIWERKRIRSNEIFWIILRSTRILKSISEFELILWLRSSHFLSNVWHEIQLIQKFSNERCDNWFRNIDSKLSIEIILCDRQLIMNRIHVDCLDRSKNLLSKESEIFFWSCVAQNVFRVLKNE
jgi:hypothetical protein